MTMTRFQAAWRSIADRWQLTVETPFVVDVSGDEIVVPVLLRDFGGTRGMLLVTDYDLIASHGDELVDQGYGYSCLPEPTGRPGQSEDDDALMEMLADWGWSGKGTPPAWYGDRSS